MPVDPCPVERASGALSDGSGRTADMLAGWGFRSGADDYVTKPFDLEVLCARIRALLRRAGQQKEHSFCCDALTLDAEKMQVFSGEKEIALSRAEYQILLLLMKTKEEPSRADSFWSRSGTAKETM